jgi:hypothetical protein
MRAAYISFMSLVLKLIPAVVTVKIVIIFTHEGDISVYLVVAR